MQQTAIVNYSRMPEQIVRDLRNGLSDLGIQIKAITSHSGEEPVIQRVLPSISHYVWGAYRYESAWSEPFDHELYEKLLASLKSTVLPLFERFGPYEGGSIEAETRAAHDFSRAQRIVDVHQPEWMLFAKEPESGLEYMLYVLARHYGIKTLMTRAAGFPHSRTVSTTLEGPILNKDWMPSAIITPVCDIENPGNILHPETQDKVNRIREDGEHYIPAYMVGKQTGRTWGDTINALAGELKKPKKLLNSFLSRADGPIYKKRLFDRYALHSTADIESKVSGPTAFFPLHYQPELTTMPLGGPFVSQVKAVKVLSDWLPKNARIYVKEHPSIFSTVNKANRNYRPKNYYDWIASIPKVHLIRPEVPSAYLQESANFTTCITGSAGMEAMIRGHKVLAFGNAAYVNGPGVYRGSRSGVDSLLRCESDKAQISKLACQFLKRLDSVALHGAVAKRDQELSIAAIQQFRITVLLAGLKKYRKKEGNDPDKETMSGAN